MGQAGQVRFTYPAHPGLPDPRKGAKRLAPQDTSESEPVS